MRLYIISAAIVFVTFVFQRIFRERLKDLKDRIAEADNRFHADLNFSSISTQLMQLELNQKTGERSAALMEAVKTLDFSRVMQDDRMFLAKLRADIGAMAQSLVRLIKALPFAKRFLNEFSAIQRDVKQATEESIEAEKSLSGNDWTQSALIKLEFIRLVLPTSATPACPPSFSQKG